MIYDIFHSLTLKHFRLFQRRTSLRVKSLTERQKTKQFSEGNSPALSEDESEGKLSYNERFLEERKRDIEAKLTIRTKIQNERAKRAQRRLEAKP